MTLIELKLILDTIGYPVAYSHFNDSPPSIPYICYRTQGTENFFADNKIYQEVVPVDIELYTEKKDLTAENKLKNALQEYGINYEMLPEVYINSEELFLNTFEVEMR
ncbi:hypothetical protein P4654_02025 [Niallia taxi]|uniref:hypothetical protein n=1 Tax=Niallia taxi TaxID=2499688 RepID=UPI002E251115|nr:hypothetical protein [Niallia taxi]MED4118077.1 hypothetical protein [Niallia taxi]